jgi:hypothetical protein
MPTDSEVLRDVGPTEVDSGGELTKKVGVHNQASRLIRSVANSKPAAVVAAQSRPEDVFRTAFVDEDEALELTQDAFGDEVEIASVESARVRGRGSAEEKLQVVVLFTLKDSGRTARGVLRYKNFSKSQKAFDDAIQSGAFNPYVSDEDPKELREELAKARKEVRRLKGQLGLPGGRQGEPDTRSAADQTGAEPVDPDEDSLADENVDVIQKRIPDLSEEELDQLEDAEKAGKDRKTVLEAISAERDSRENA